MYKIIIIQLWVVWTSTNIVHPSLSRAEILQFGVQLGNIFKQFSIVPARQHLADIYVTRRTQQHGIIYHRCIFIEYIRDRITIIQIVPSTLKCNIFGLGLPLPGNM